MEKTNKESCSQEVILIKNFSTVEDLKNKIKETINIHQKRLCCISNQGNYISLSFR